MGRPEGQAVFLAGLRGGIRLDQITACYRNETGPDRS
jgi:hypothetical protein